MKLTWHLAKSQTLIKPVENEDFWDALPAQPSLGRPVSRPALVARQNIFFTANIFSLRSGKKRLGLLREIKSDPWPAGWPASWQAACSEGGPPEHQKSIRFIDKTIGILILKPL